MDKVADYVDAFVRRAKDGKKPTVRIKKQYAEAFLGGLSREGIKFAKDCLGNISDPELRRIIEAIFFATVAGAATGAVIGTVVAGPPGAQVGAVVGASVGFVAGCIAVIIVEARQDQGPEGPELVLAIQ